MASTQLAFELAAPGSDDAEIAIDYRRRAPWLLSPYSALTWTVADTRDVNRTEDISFEYRLANGKMLHESERLYAVVKEYAWWLRDSRYSRIDDALTHATMVWNMKHLAHALSIRKLQSFSQLQPYDVEILVEECRFGMDAVTRASDRLETYLSELAEKNLSNPKPGGGLPHYVQPSGRRHNHVHVAQVLEACNLPESARLLPRVSVILKKAAAAHGFAVKGDVPKDLPPLENLTAQALQRWLDPLEQLYAMRRRIEAEPITFRPFAFGAARVAAIKGVGTSRTPTAPPRLAIHLLEQSVRWIFDKGGAIETRTAGPTSVKRMATACWIIIAAFTARRVEEIYDLRNDCLRGDDASGWWLQVYIEKTLQRKEWIPVPLMVVRAIEMLRIISESARRETQGDGLFQWLSPGGELLELNVGRYLDDFATQVNVPMHTPRGSQPIVWHWHPHQFRRFFAILYFYRYEVGSIEALSHHLRHFSLEMTRRYVTEDPEVAALWSDTEWGYVGSVARAIVAGERSVAGAAGEKLKKAAKRFVDLFRRKLQVVTPERVGASLAVMMQRQGMILTPKPWVTCTCPRTWEAAQTAACRRRGLVDSEAAGPDFAQAGPTVCSSCPHAMTEGSRQSFVDVEIQRLQSVAASKPRAGTIFGALEDARILELQDVRDSRYVGARPLDGMTFDDEGAA